MHRSRFAFMMAADIGIIATFLPWENIIVMGTISDSLPGTKMAESILGTTGVGWVSLVLFALATIVAVTGKRQQAVSSIKKYTLVVLGLLTAIVGIHTYLDVKQKAVLNPQENGGLSFESSAGIGIYVVVAAALAIIIIAFIPQKNKST